jgi:hypothetical protein
VPVKATVLDLSVTGARLFLVSPPPIGLRTVLGLRLDEACGQVVVRHAEQWTGCVLCGVEFVELDGALADRFHRAVAGEDAPDEDRWRASR